MADPLVIHYDSGRIEGIPPRRVSHCGSLWSVTPTMGARIVADEGAVTCARCLASMLLEMRQERAGREAHHG